MEVLPDYIPGKDFFFPSGIENNKSLGYCIFLICTFNKFLIKDWCLPSILSSRNSKDPLNNNT